jgi:hypothetical protein
MFKKWLSYDNGTISVKLGYISIILSLVLFIIQVVLVFVVIDTHNKKLNKKITKEAYVITLRCLKRSDDIQKGIHALISEDYQNNNEAWKGIVISLPSNIKDNRDDLLQLKGTLEERCKMLNNYFINLFFDEKEKENEETCS